MQHKHAKVGRMWALWSAVSVGVAACGALMSGCGGGGGHHGTGTAQPMLGVNGRIAFGHYESSSGPGVYTANPDGTDQRLLVAAAYSPSWSPDGQQLVAIANTNGNNNLVIVRADGSKVRRFPLPSVFNAPLAWSPLGDRIAFNTFVQNRSAIATVRSDGSDFQVLTTDAQNPSWSPDGKRLTFNSTGTERVYPNEICVVNADGTGKKAILRRPLSDFNPKWSPDGQRILFQSSAGGSSSLLTMKPNGSDVRLIDTARAGLTAAFSATYSPDARKILFAGFGNASGLHHYTINVDGTGLIPIPLDNNYDNMASWGTNPITTPPFPTAVPTVSPTPGFTNPPPF